jgi:hypothetical protein
MFRMNIPQVDPAEEKKAVRESVRNTIAIFVVLCSMIRIGEFSNSHKKPKFLI